MRQKKEKKVWGGLVAGTEDFKVIKDSVDASFQIIADIENAKAELKDAFEEVHAKTGIPRRTWNAICRWNYKGNSLEAISKNEELKETWETLQGQNDDTI